MTNKTCFKVMRFTLASAAAFLALVGCGQVDTSRSAQPVSENSSNSVSELPSTTPSLPSAPAKSYVAEPLAWESSKHPERLTWSSYTMQVVSENFDRLDKASDMATFCPNYSALSKEQKINAWADLIAGIAKPESSWDPTNRMQEDFSYNDPITKQPVWSEGLLQLSYQDILAYPFCHFDWGKDKGLSGRDPRKTILDPYTNLSCGIQILAKQIDKRGSIVLSKNVYWSVIRTGSKHITEIAGYVKKLTFCTK